MHRPEGNLPLHNLDKEAVLREQHQLAAVRV